MDKPKDTLLSRGRKTFGKFMSTDNFIDRGMLSRFAFSVIRAPLWFVAGASQRGLWGQVKFSIVPGFLRSNLYPREFVPSAVASLPEIEALIVVAGKDFDVLPHTIANLQPGSANKIVRITLVTPAQDVKLCEEIAAKLRLRDQFEMKVLNEDQVFSDSYRRELKNRFQNRYGWVLQQLLTTKLALQSSARGVLVVDADTVLLQPRVWLTSEGLQPLLVSSEFHESYYRFLATLGISRRLPKNTHVTHHMLMQPSKLKKILEFCNLDDVESLGKAAMLAEGLDADSPVCLEYEFYAQGMFQLFPKAVRLLRFSNAGVSTSNQLLDVQALIEENRSNTELFSISLHTYLRSK